MAALHRAGVLAVMVVGLAAAGGSAAAARDATPDASPTPEPSLTPGPRTFTHAPAPEHGTPSRGRVAARTPGSCPSVPLRPVRHAPGTGRTVALTFDDGPGGITPQVRQVLRRHGVRATFFMNGTRSVKWPSQVARLAADGHLIANHGWDHHYPSVTRPWTVHVLRSEMRRTGAALAQATAQVPDRQPMCFYRPPGGILTNVMPAARAQGLTVALWSVDSRDWAQPARTTRSATAQVVRAATADPGEHPVVLLHVAKASHEPASRVSANRGNTLAALHDIIRWYKMRGYRFVDLAGQSGLRPL